MSFAAKGTSREVGRVADGCRNGIAGAQPFWYNVRRQKRLNLTSYVNWPE